MCLRRTFPITDPNAYRLLYNSLDLNVNQLPAQDSKALSTVLAYLEESFQPPDLEDTFANQNDHLEDAPPFDSAVCAFCCVSVGSFTNDDIGLFVFDLSEEFRQLSDWIINLASARLSVGYLFTFGF
jgi:hypothetical protein